MTTQFKTELIDNEAVYEIDDIQENSIEAIVSYYPYVYKSGSIEWTFNVKLTKKGNGVVRLTIQNWADNNAEDNKGKKYVDAGWVKQILSRVKQLQELSGQQQALSDNDDVDLEIKEIVEEIKEVSGMGVFS